MTNIIGRIDELTKEQRRALRTRARMQRKLANGVKLCGAKTRMGPALHRNGTGEWQMQKSRRREHWRADAGGQGEISVQAQTVSEQKATN
jgi:hypothetical protein